jgi:hypothetical protein
MKKEFGSTVKEWKQRENYGVEVRDTLFPGQKKSILMLEGPQTMPTRLSNEDITSVKTLRRYVVND